MVSFISALLRYRESLLLYLYKHMSIIRVVYFRDCSHGAESDYNTANLLKGCLLYGRLLYLVYIIGDFYIRGCLLLQVFKIGCC